VAHAGRERKRLRRSMTAKTPGVQVREQRHFEQNFGVVTIARPQRGGTCAATMRLAISALRPKPSMIRSSAHSRNR
jgi:hypothetical protein